MGGAGGGRGGEGGGGEKKGDERENVAVDRWENPTERRRRGKKKGDELWIDGRGSQREREGERDREDEKQEKKE